MRCRFRAALLLFALLATAGCGAGGVVPGAPPGVSSANPKDIFVVIEEGQTIERPVQSAAHPADSRTRAVIR
jgi:hypothetical protein